jgi:hypothetical protein
METIWPTQFKGGQSKRIMALTQPKLNWSPNYDTCIFGPKFGHLHVLLLKRLKGLKKKKKLIMKDEYPHSLFDRVKKKIQYHRLWEAT